MHLTPRVMVSGAGCACFHLWKDILCSARIIRSVNGLIPSSHASPLSQIHRNGNLMGFDLSSPGCGNFYEKPGNPADNLVMERKPFEVRADPFPSFTEAWGMTRVYKMIQTPPA